MLAQAGESRSHWSERYVCLFQSLDIVVTERAAKLAQDLLKEQVHIRCGLGYADAGLEAAEYEQRFREVL